MILDFIHKKTLLEIDYIEILMAKINSHYFRFSINKANGGKRLIHHPSKELKTIQRVLSDYIICTLPVHACSTAYKIGCSTKKNAQIHAKHKYVLRMDFKSFFESITFQDVYSFCQTEMKRMFSEWEDIDSEIFSKFVCYKERLVMGAVTSPALTNAMCYNLDNLLFEMAGLNGVAYSRYADDLYFSTDKPKILKNVEFKVLNIVSSLSNPAKLKINSSKTFHSSRKRKIVITGLVITNSGEVSIGRDKKRQIRSYVFNWDSLDEMKKSYISGYLSYIKSVEPEFINSLCLKYSAELVDKVIKYNQAKY